MSESGSPSVNPRQAGAFSGRRVLVAVTGGIAAYKTCIIVRDLVRGGAEVQVLMTPAATKFVTPLTFATLSGRSVICELFPETAPSDPIHLEPASWGELLVVAPATADFVGKLTNGLADDIPSTVAMAFKGPILLAPAMNPKMWSSPAVSSNIAILRERGIFLVGPSSGEMGGIHEEAGTGRMSEPEAIVERAEDLLSTRRNWVGKRVLVTTGPTREPLDPVRYIGNRSSGKMGNAIAREAALRGAEVYMIRGRGATAPAPHGVRLFEVDTAAEMFAMVREVFPQVDILFMTAAVADWTPVKPARQKLKKAAGAPVIELKETADILAWAGRAKIHQFVVGFALETADHMAHALKKLETKDADLIVLNDPTRSDSSFGGDTTRLTVIGRDNFRRDLESLSKRKAASELLDEMEGMVSFE